MELKHFVKQTLLEVIQGVKEAQAEAGVDHNNKNLVNPMFTSYKVQPVELRMSRN